MISSGKILFFRRALRKLPTILFVIWVTGVGFQKPSMVMPKTLEVFKYNDRPSDIIERYNISDTDPSYEVIREFLINGPGRWRLFPVGTVPQFIVRGSALEVTCNSGMMIVDYIPKNHSYVLSLIKVFTGCDKIIDAAIQQHAK